MVKPCSRREKVQFLLVIALISSAAAQNIGYGWDFVLGDAYVENSHGMEKFLNVEGDEEIPYVTFPTDIQVREDGSVLNGQVGHIQVMNRDVTSDDSYINAVIDFASFVNENHRQATLATIFKPVSVPETTIIFNANQTMKLQLTPQGSLEFSYGSGIVCSLENRVEIDEWYLIVVKVEAITDEPEEQIRVTLIINEPSNSQKCQSSDPIADSTWDEWELSSSENSDDFDGVISYFGLWNYLISDGKFDELNDKLVKTESSEPEGETVDTDSLEDITDTDFTDDEDDVEDDKDSGVQSQNNSTGGSDQEDAGENQDQDNTVTVEGEDAADDPNSGQEENEETEDGEEENTEDQTDGIDGTNSEDDENDGKNDDKGDGDKGNTPPTCEPADFWEKVNKTGWKFSALLSPVSGGSTSFKMHYIIELNVSEDPTGIDGISWVLLFEKTSGFPQTWEQELTLEGTKLTVELEHSQLSHLKNTRRFVEFDSATYVDYPFTFEVKSNCAGQDVLDSRVFNLALKYELHLETVPGAALILSDKTLSSLNKVDNSRHKASLELSQQKSRYEKDDPVSLVFGPHSSSSSSLTKLKLNHLFQITTVDDVIDVLSSNSTNHIVESDGSHKVTFKTGRDGTFLILAIGETQTTTRRFLSSSSTNPSSTFTASMYLQVGDQKTSSDSNPDKPGPEREYFMMVIMVTFGVVIIGTIIGFIMWKRKKRQHDLFYHSDTMNTGDIEFIDRKKSYDFQTSSGTLPRKKI